jgi:hypothetical protein
MLAQEQVELFDPTMTHVGARYQTFRRSFEEICGGEDPWIPLGKFMHQFFGEYKECRDELVHNPLILPEHVTIGQFRWAVFCAASVEHLCKKYDLACPEWAMHPLYTLEEPWYHGIGADHPQVQEKLRKTTPEEFAKRNIFCGDRVFSNKYEGRQRRRRNA